MDHWVELARLLERGKFDGLFLADVVGVYDVYGGSPDIALREAAQVPTNDPLLNLSHEPPLPFARRPAARLGVSHVDHADAANAAPTRQSNSRLSDLSRQGQKSGPDATKRGFPLFDWRAGHASLHTIRATWRPSTTMVAMRKVWSGEVVKHRCERLYEEEHDRCQPQHKQTAFPGPGGRRHTQPARQWPRGLVRPALTVQLDNVGPGSGLLVSPADLTRLNGFERKPQGACFEELCIPLNETVLKQQADATWLDLEAFANLLEQPFVADRAAGVWSFGEIPQKRSRTLDNAQAPEFEVTDRAGQVWRLADLKGKKALIVTWSSW
jgi:hypothetical protein